MECSRFSNFKSWLAVLRSTVKEAKRLFLPLSTKKPTNWSSACSEGALPQAWKTFLPMSWCLPQWDLLRWESAGKTWGSGLTDGLSASFSRYSSSYNRKCCKSRAKILQDRSFLRQLGHAGSNVSLHYFGLQMAVLMHISEGSRQTL